MTEVKDMNNEELSVLIKQIKNRRTILRLEATNHFKVGEKVWFDGRSRGIIHGEITKVNKTTINVRTEHRGIWKVSASVLKAEEKDQILEE